MSNTTMKRIDVEVSKAYPVYLGDGIIDEIAELIAPVCTSDRVVIVTDDVVDALYGDVVQKRLCSSYQVDKYVFPHGEQSKNIGTLSGILEFLAMNGVKRRDTLIALGGGVVGDITGLAAAIYMRGVKVIQVPTTLLSIVDSSIGGKTAIDLKHGKNLAGAFWQPSMVIGDTSIIRDLPDEVFNEGMAEVIKCNVIRSMSVIDCVLNGSVKENIGNLIEQCILLKRDIVQQDEFDSTGIRNILNVGHTYAHAIEKLSEYTVSHGKAVGIGLVKEAEIAKKYGICSCETVDRIKAAVREYGMIVEYPYSGEQIANAMLSDKKNTDQRVTFELPKSIGDCTEVKLSVSEIISILR